MGARIGTKKAVQLEDQVSAPAEDLGFWLFVHLRGSAPPQSGLDKV